MPAGDRVETATSAPERSLIQSTPAEKKHSVYGMPDEMANLNEVRAPSPVENPAEERRHTQSFLEDAPSRGEDLCEAPGQSPKSESQGSFSPEPKELKSGEQVSRIVTELYLLSYLILFSILGTLARLGLEGLTTYPGSPVATGVLWANFGGSLVMGFLSEDRKLFKHDDNGQHNASTEIGSDDNLRATGINDEGIDRTIIDHVYKEARIAASQKAHMSIKKTVPLYIGLATGFCGSFTSFSTFIRDVFLALSNNAPTIISSNGSTILIARNGGRDFMALVAIIIYTVCLCLAALRLGAYLAIAIQRIVPSLPGSPVRKSVDRAAVFLAWGMWLGAVFLAIWPPDRPFGPAADGRTSWSQETWRGKVLFALVLSPVGCIGRFYASLLLNGISATFPIGTFAANIFGTLVLGMAYDLQRAPLGSGVVGGGLVGCQVLQGVQDGFCGCLTTISTWVLELASLRRRHAFFYGAMSIGVALTSLVVIMGSLSWTRGFSAPACS